MLLVYYSGKEPGYRKASSNAYGSHLQQRIIQLNTPTVLRLRNLDLEQHENLKNSKI
jgi:hypothetical protein